jgi:predicted lipid-binding transport protein (Tim44 family)
MNEASKGKTYEQVSGQYVGLSDADKASPDGQALGQLRQTLFMGDTLRGLLLYGYAFATIGTIAGVAALVSGAAAVLLLLLAGLGLWHARRAQQSSDLPVAARKVPQPA